MAHLMCHYGSLKASASVLKVADSFIMYEGGGEHLVVLGANVSPSVQQHFDDGTLHVEHSTVQGGDFILVSGFQLQSFVEQPSHLQN